MGSLIKGSFKPLPTDKALSQLIQRAADKAKLKQAAEGEDADLLDTAEDSKSRGGKKDASSKKAESAAASAPSKETEKQRTKRVAKELAEAKKAAQQKQVKLISDQLNAGVSLRRIQQKMRSVV